MSKLTKIIATIGPSSDSPEVIEELIKNGVNIFRFNFKHNVTDWHKERIIRVNEVAKKLNVPIGTLIDLQGPEIRIKMPFDQLELSEGEEIVFGHQVFETQEKGFSISHPDVIQYLEHDQKIVADDGAFTFKVKKNKDDIKLICQNKGTLKMNKSLNIPGADFPFPVLIERDFEGLKLAQTSEIDYVALSFVRTADDIRILKEKMKEHNVHAKIVSKIETQKAVDNIDEILEETDAIMVARGDLGVEVPLERVPYYQKMLIKKCLEKAIPVITATQMLQTMIDNPMPTRAEVSDVANAIYDLTDAIMLSGETASGSYPIKAVSAMNKIALYNEKRFHKDNRKLFNYVLNDQESMICDTAYNLHLQTAITGKMFAGFVVFTHSGRTAALLSRYRPLIPIYTFAPSKDVCEQITINFGIKPFIQTGQKNRDVQGDEIMQAINYLVEEKYLNKGETVIVLHGDIWAKQGGTSMIKIIDC